MMRKKAVNLILVVVALILSTSYLWMFWEKGRKESQSGVEASEITVRYEGTIYTNGDGDCTIILPLFDMKGYTDEEVLNNLRYESMSGKPRQTPQPSARVGIINVVEAGYLRNSSGIDIEEHNALKLNISQGCYISTRDISCSSTTLTLRERGEKGSYWMFIQPKGNVTHVTIMLWITFQIKGKEGWYLVFFRNVTREEWGWVKFHPYRFIENKSPNYHLSYYHYALKVQSDGNYTIYAPLPINTVWTDDVLLSKIYTGGGIDSVEIINISEGENITINSNVENGSKALVVKGSGSGVLSFLYPSKVPSPAISLPSLEPFKYWFYYEGDEESVAIKPIICREYYLMITLTWYPQFEILKPGWNLVEIKEAPVI